ncbi:signal peptidase I [Flavobacterium sp. W21_SRS_FM6]|uniref:signal peptidase I n=1 Tax=Flavobacterium sp. W21_SRS_FM6 TaxID=3240268 RepID=UPI003F8EA420
MKNLVIKIAKSLKKNLSFFMVLLALFASRSSLADWYIVPTGSMQPTIVEGDRILVNKMAYRLELPFTNMTVFDIDKPKRGDIVTLNSSAADTRLVKRVIGLPGDMIAMRDNKLVVNGRMVAYQNTASSHVLIEQLAEKSHAVQLKPVAEPMDNFDAVRVPPGQFLLLGDNRNNSADSRVFGFFSEHEIQGKAVRVLVSLDPNDSYLPRKTRFLKPLI